MKEVSCLLIRHGKTQGNIEKRYIGCKTDIGLCDLGIEELRKSVISNMDIRLAKKVYVSPLKRCRQTAEILFPKHQIMLCEELKEMDFGQFENKNYEELKDNPDYQKWIDSGGSIGFPGGESREDFINRNIRAFRQIIKDNENEKKHIAFVLHGGSIMAILSQLTGEDYYSFQIACGEAYAVRCIVDEEKIDVISYNRIFSRSDS